VILFHPNLPPPDLDKKILFESLDNIEKLDLNQLAIAHFGIHKNPYKLIRNAKESINNWIDFINKLPNLSDKKASEELINWIKTNYQSLGIDEVTINNYVGTGNFEMQINGVRTFLNNRIL
jgi:hypothetical protein